MRKQRKPKYDWQEIQKYHDKKHTWAEIRDKFGCSTASLAKARKRGAFISRSKSDAMQIAVKKYPRKHTEETKQKISKARISYLEKHPDKVPYLLNHYSKNCSYPEKYFEKLFRNEKIKLIHHFRVGLYELDFSDPDKKIDIEIDGDQHYLDQRIVASDKRRTENLQNLKWTVYRVRWSDYQKMTWKNKRKVVNEIKVLLSL